jgi:hypothetical protein
MPIPRKKFLTFFRDASTVLNALQVFLGILLPTILAVIEAVRVIRGALR